jgi:hypothetical protein
MVHSDRYLMWSHVYVKKKKKKPEKGSYSLPLFAIKIIL